ncbi:hypothetical protein ACSAZK_05135 [Methanosarcina sp. Mfa9]
MSVKDIWKRLQDSRNKKASSSIYCYYAPIEILEFEILFEFES